MLNKLIQNEETKRNYVSAVKDIVILRDIIQRYNIKEPKLLEDAFLVHKSERYDVKGKDNILGNAKYYINDMAYKNYLYTGFGYGIGCKLENIVYLILKRAGYKIYTDVTNNKEVDFVALKDDNILYIKTTYLLIDENTISREYKPIEQIADNYEKVEDSLDEVAFPLKGGIKHIQIWNFRP